MMVEEATGQGTQTKTEALVLGSDTKLNLVKEKYQLTTFVAEYRATEHRARLYEVGVLGRG